MNDTLKVLASTLTQSDERLLKEISHFLGEPEPYEIERKFLVKTIPENLSAFTCHSMTQGYLNTSPVVRVRKEDNNYYLTQQWVCAIIVQ